MARAASLSAIWRGRGLVLRLAQAQLRDRYSGSALGVLWALLQPAMVMAVFWFVFSYGLRVASPAGEAPFVALLLVGLVAWFWFNDAVSMGTHAVTGSAYLVKKVAFPLELLPLAPVLASLLVHLGLLLLLLLGLALSGHAAGWRVLLLPVYMLGTATLASGLAYWFSALHVFHRDVAQTAMLVLQLWFWLTPIVWSFAAFPPEVSAVLSWNPMAHVVEGYRHALLAEVTAPPPLPQAIAFWSVSLFVLVTGVAMFRRLRADFADVL
jgi:ABC-type polysaccharide/polyol phosphate export permease